MSKYASFLFIIILSGCGVNSAVYVPLAYAPSTPIKKWDGSHFAASTSEKALPDSICPLSLAEAIDIALKNSPQTRKSWAIARAAAARYGQTESSFFPAIGLEGNVGKFRTPNIYNKQVEEVEQTRYGPKLTLSYTLFDFGTRRASSNAAKFALYEANFTHNRAIESTLNTVVEKYYTLAYQNELLSALENDLNTAEKSLQAATLENDKGVKSVSDMLQAKSNYLEKRTKWQQQKSSVNQSYIELATSMGIPATTDFSILSLPEVACIKSAQDDLQTLITFAMEKRSDLRSFEANLRSKEEELKMASRSWLPTVDLNGEIGRTYFDHNFHDNFDYQAQLSLKFPLFNGFYYRNGIKIAEANREKAAAELESKKLEVLGEIKSAHFNANIAGDTLEDALAFYASAEKEYDVALQQYHHGINSILELLAAQNSLATARAKKAESLRNYYTSFASLAFSTGALEPTNEEDNDDSF